MNSTKPTTRSAYLFSKSAGRATLHTYVETRPCEVSGPEPQAWEYIFRCSVTGDERRWGLSRVESTETN